MHEASIFEIAELVLKSGRDRIASLPDRRRLAKLRRFGLLIYPDGYSVTPAVMERAASWWRVVARDVTKHGDPDFAAYLNQIADEADAWAQKHVTRKDMLKVKFGTLPFQAYVRLWETVTHPFGATVLEGELYNYEKVLLTEGYLMRRNVADMLVPSEKGREAVREYGDPFLDPRVAK